MTDRQQAVREELEPSMKSAVYSLRTVEGLLEELEVDWWLARSYMDRLERDVDRMQALLAGLG